LEWLPEQLWEAIEMMRGTKALKFAKVIQKLFFAVRSRKQSASCDTESLDALVRSLSEYERLEANHDAFEVLGSIGKSFCTVLFAQRFKTEYMRAGRSRQVKQEYIQKLATFRRAYPMKHAKHGGTDPCSSFEHYLRIGERLLELVIHFGWGALIMPAYQMRVNE
jgi:hypothetical protein